MSFSSFKSIGENLVDRQSEYLWLAKDIITANYELEAKCFEKAFKKTIRDFTIIPTNIDRVEFKRYLCIHTPFVVIKKRKKVMHKSYRFTKMNPVIGVECKLLTKNGGIVGYVHYHYDVKIPYRNHFIKKWAWQVPKTWMNIFQPQSAINQWMLNKRFLEDIFREEGKRTYTVEAKYL